MVKKGVTQMLPRFLLTRFNSKINLYKMICYRSSKKYLGIMNIKVQNE